MSVVGCSTSTTVSSRKLTRTTTTTATTISNVVTTRWPTKTTTPTEQPNNTQKTRCAFAISSTSITATQFYIVALLELKRHPRRVAHETTLLDSNHNPALDTTVSQPINLGIDVQRPQTKEHQVFAPLIDNYYIYKYGQQLCLSAPIVAAPKPPTVTTIIETYTTTTRSSCQPPTNYWDRIESNPPTPTLYRPTHPPLPPPNHPHRSDAHKVTIIDRSRTIRISIALIHLKRCRRLAISTTLPAGAQKTKSKSTSSTPSNHNYYVALLLLLLTAASSSLSRDNQSVHGMLLLWCSTTLNANPCESIANQPTTITGGACLHGTTTVAVDTAQHLLTMLLNRNHQYFGALLRHHSASLPTLCVIVLVLMCACVPVISASSSSSSSSSSASAPSSSSSSSSSASSFANVKYSRHTVKTKYGPLRGIMVRANPPVEAYLGVPYATPPVGSLRYMPPVTPSTWRNTRLADRFSAVCPQLSPIPTNDDEARVDIPRGRLAQLRRLLPQLVNQSEDCLYLNLYVPRSDHASKSPLATVVYIHGESFEWNSGNTYDGSVLAGLGNVIVVTINFRLGVLGFLKTGSKGSAQGNFGLMDLVAGLHWLRENIPAFNGDAGRITVMGHSTGAALANILIVSPVASDLIHRAILLSGSAMSPWAIQRDPLYVKRKVAEHTGCHGDLLEDDMAPCLRGKSIEELLTVKINAPRFLPGFAPFVDGTVILNAVRSIPLTLPSGSAIASTSDIELADFPAKALLFGLTSTESYLDLNAQDLEYGFNETRRDRIFRTYVRNVYRFHLNEIFSTLKNEYTDWERPPRNPLGPRDATMEFLSDGHTAASLIRLAYLHSLRGGVSYFMHFKHESGDRDFPQRFGSVRGEDVPFFFGLPITNILSHNYSRKDVQISRTLLQYVTNFIRQGTPNESPSATSNVDTYAYESNESAAVEGSQHRHQQSIQMLGGAASSDSNHKRKRQTANSHRKTNKRSSHSTFAQPTSDDDSDEFDNGDEYDVGERPRSPMNALKAKQQQQRTDETAAALWRIPFWDTYDSINQLYLEIGNKLEIRNHYRGHKLSMWLSLIPQLHNPGELVDLSMRHHHFSEESAQFYDGIVRPQTLQPTAYKSPTNAMARPPPVVKVERVPAVLPADIPRTECAPNTTIVTTIAATHHIQSTQPQTYSIAVSTTSNHNNNNVSPSNTNSHPQTTLLQQQTTNNNLLRRLADSQYQSYATALTVTVTVGCLLLLLNVLIFAGIYYQREKQVNDSMKKDELQTTATNSMTNSTSETMDGGGMKTAPSCASIHDIKCNDGSGIGRAASDRKHSLQSMSDNMHLNEYVMCADDGQMAHCLLRSTEKKSPHLQRHAQHHQQQQQQHQPQKQHADICHLDVSAVDDFKCPMQSGPSSTAATKHAAFSAAHRHSMEVAGGAVEEYYQFSGFATPNHNKHHHQAAANNHAAQHLHSSHHSLQVTLPRYSPYLGSTTRLNQKTAPREQCNQSTQSDIPDVHDVGTGAMDNDVDIIQCHSSRSTENVRASSCDAATLTSSPPPSAPIAVTLPRGGILRHQSSSGGGSSVAGGGGGGSASTSATPTASKKRVHIQEISV